MIKPDENILDYVDDYVHGLLSAEDAEIVERFCESSRLGQVALEEARQRYEAMQVLPPAEASEPLVQKTVHNIESTDRRSRRVRKIYVGTVAWAAAAAVLVIASLNTFYYRLQPSPYDLRLLGQSGLLSGSPAALRVAVWNRQTGRPVAGVPVQIALVNKRGGQEVALADQTTDAAGSVAPRFELPDWDDGTYELRVVAQAGGAREVLARSVELRRDWRLMISSDKPVYQPGQTIHVRSLALKKPDLRPVAGSEVVFTVSDPKGNVIFKQRDVTSRFGIASTDCPLAREILEGEYRLQCSVGSTSSELSVKVEKYVLPKFKIDVTLDKSFYAPGETVRGAVQADYFFGKPVADGSVQIEVRAMEVGPATVAAVEVRTGAEGRAEFSFRLPDRMIGREQESGGSRFFLAATVTDRAGQQHAVGTSRVVTAEPIQVAVIPEGGSLVQGVANTVYLITNYADGRPAETRVVVHGLENELQTNSLGVAAFEITPSTPQFGLTVKATDAEGRVGRRNVQLRCGTAGTDFLIRPDKAVYAGGETMQLEALGGGVEPVFVDLLKDGQTMWTAQIEMQNWHGQLAVDLPPELFGTLEIVAYRFGSQGLPVRKSRTILVQQARQLAIHATLDQDEYRPGTQATVKLKLTDGEGQPVPGAISLQAVDEAVYSVLRQRSNLEETFFLLEQELLEPVYTIYPGWSPALFSELPAVDRTQWQQALFSSTAAGAEGSAALPDVFLHENAAAPGELDAMQETVEMPMVAPWSGEPASAGERPSPYTLAAASFPAKAQDVAARRHAGLHDVTVAWWTLAAGLLLAGVAGFALFYPRAFLMTSLIGGAACCLLGVPLAATMWLLGAAAPLGMADRFDARFGFAGAEAPTAEMAWLEPTDEMPMAGVPAEQAAPPPRVRQWFPETLLWRPELITDDNGEATLEVDLADSITTWRLTSSAVSSQGQLGGGEFPIKVFQPFFVDLNLPVSLTRNDQVGVPVVVYNYLDDPQTVTLTLATADWFERLDGSADSDPDEASADEAAAEPGSESSESLTLELGPGEIRSLHFPLRVVKVGRHQLEVTATASGVADAIRREIEVVPDGRRMEETAGGILVPAPVEVTLNVPEQAIEGSVRAIVKLYPSSFSQVVEGLDAIFQMPYGCFEQTSSTTYPNVLALDYLRRTDKSVPEVEAKARQYIHLGYQRLISFEVDGGGFDWFGNPPANRTLTAYGLMEFRDMARVHDVDPQLIQRTRDWLLAQRRADGSWLNESGMLDDGLAGSVNRGGDLNLAATAYIAWAVFGDTPPSPESAATLDYLLSHSADSIASPYLLALTANAIAAMASSESRLDSYLARLDAMKQSGEDGKQAWWAQAAGERTAFYGSGRAGDIETTALAALALMRSSRYAGTARAALTWLVEQKDPQGTWHSTQATVLALKALLAGTAAPLGEEKERRVEITLGGETIREIVIPPDQAEVMQMLDLSDLFVPGNEYRLQLADRSDASIGYQVALRYHVEEKEAETGPQDQPRLSVDVVYDRQRLDVDDTVTAVATVTNLMQQPAPMVILDLPIPGGFAIDGGELDELVGSQLIARYQITARQAIIYLRQLEPGQQLELRYRLRATMPVKVAVPDAEVYEYYDPANRARGGSTQLEALKS